MAPHSIATLNALSPAERLQWYARLVPPPLLQQFAIDPVTLSDPQGRPLLTIHGAPESPSVELDLRHAVDAPDPLYYGHFTDTLNGPIAVLLVTVNNPAGPRFEVDRMPDGTPTDFGTSRRNLDAEAAALQAGLAPGQVRAGLRAMPLLLDCFEQFLADLGHTLYIVEPLKYHTAILFERLGLAYEVGRRWMQSIDYRFTAADGDLRVKLNGSTPFRQPRQGGSVLGRSWAIHDGILGEPFNHVRMYKTIGKHHGVDTAPALPWR